MTEYECRTLEMLTNWVAGTSTHNRIDNECCPDFSCCNPELFEQDREKRLKRLNEYRVQHGYSVCLDS